MFNEYPRHAATNEKVRKISFKKKKKKIYHYRGWLSKLFGSAIDAHQRYDLVGTNSWLMNL